MRFPSTTLFVSFVLTTSRTLVTCLPNSDVNIEVILFSFLSASLSRHLTCLGSQVNALYKKKSIHYNGLQIVKVELLLAFLRVIPRNYEILLSLQEVK